MKVPEVYSLQDWSLLLKTAIDIRHQSNHKIDFKEWNFLSTDRQELHQVHINASEQHRKLLLIRNQPAVCDSRKRIPFCERIFTKKECHNNMGEQ